MNLKKSIACLLGICLMLSAVGTVFADELETKRSELENVQQQLEAQQNRANKAQQEVQSVSEQLRKVQNELDGAQKDYNEIQTKLAATEQQIAVNTGVLAKSEKNLAERSGIFNKRIRDIYENGQLSYLDVLLGAKDFRDFTSRMDILKRIISYDISLMNKIKAERELVLQKKAELDRDRGAILVLKKSADEKKQLIVSQKAERERVLNAAVSEKDSAERAYQELLDTSRQIQQMIRRIQSGGSKPGAAGSGAMMWPINGPITSEFGWRIHPIFGTQRYHSGLDIGADYGEPVAAADSGVVIYSDWMGGYGKAVIIDHGSGLSTLYGHNSELLVGEGERVQKGQAIAYAGSTGYSTGPHVHFEVRKNGAEVSPKDYLP